jgi:CRP/FNR family transcriptional regulator, cyclic AMP receptor protein
VAVHATSVNAVFLGLDPAVLDEVLEVLSGCARLEVGTGEVLYPVDVPDAALLLVERGLLALRAEVASGRRGVITCHAGAGAVVVPPLPGETLRVLDDAVVVVVSADTRVRLLALPAAAAVVVDALAAALRQKTQTIAALSSFHHVDRLRSKLVQLAQEHGRVGRDGIRIDLRLTHDLLAEMIGSARETVTRAFDELQREGVVSRDGREYVLRLPPEGLTPLM